MHDWEIGVGNYQGGWSEEDLRAPASHDAVEDDPWGSPPVVAAARTYDPEVAGFVAQPQDGPVAGASDEDDGAAADEVHDWSGDEQIDSEPTAADLANIDGEQFEVDEPEPRAEYDSALAQPLYNLDDDTDFPWARIRVDEWLAGLKLDNDIQREGISGLLLELSDARLRHMLPWLRSKKWTGRNLLLFLEFRRHWESESQKRWWESRYWSFGEDQWLSVWNLNSLSRDNLLELVLRRFDCTVGEVIDESWFKDWDRLGLWKHEFPVFGHFAMFRAETRDENWLDLIDWYSDGYAVHQIQESPWRDEDSPTEESEWSRLSAEIISQVSDLQKGAVLAILQEYGDLREWDDGLRW